MAHLTRHKMYLRIEEFFKEERKGKVLCVDGTGIGNYFHKDSIIVTTKFPEIDIHELPYNETEFDYVVCDQVIEHVENPWKAVDEIYRVLKVGGWMILTTCLIMGIHKLPNDYWRFTPDGLRLLSKKFGEIFQCEGWGNGTAVALTIDKGLGFTEVIPGKRLETIALENDNKNFIVTWIIAKKEK